MHDILVHDLKEVRVGSGEPLVFLHGLGANRMQCVSALDGLNYNQIFCPDIPGADLAAGARPGFGAFADRLQHQLDKKGIDRAILGGISMGAGLALRMALDAPDRVAGLILVRPAWIGQAALPHLALVARIGRWLDQLPDEAASRLAADSDYLAIRYFNPPAADSLMALLSFGSGATLDAMVHDRPFSRLSELEAITCPTVVFGNEDDPLHPVGIAQILANRLPNARYNLIPSRYLAPSEHFSELNARIEDFLVTLGER